MTTTTKTLDYGTKIEVKGTRWGHQFVFTMRGSYEKDKAMYARNNMKQRPITENTGPWVSLCAEAYCIHNGPYVPENRVEVSVGEVVRIKGHGLWKVEKPGFMDGDNCQLVPVCKIAKKYAKMEKKFVPPRDCGGISYERWMSE